MSFGPEWQRSPALSVTELREPVCFPPAAVELLEWTLGEAERVHGREDAETVALRRRLALVLQGRGRVTEALPLFEHVLARQERVQGVSAPDTLEARYELALALRDVGRPGRAVTMLAGAVDEVERVLGAGHALALASRELFAQLQRSEGC